MMDGLPKRLEKNFTVIGLTLPGELNLPEEEALAISHFLSSGAVDLFHIRKPEASADFTAQLMDLIPSDLYPRIVIHSHYEFCGVYRFGGFHLKDFPLPDDFRGYVTRSCHSLAELAISSRSFSYSFLSPIFDSLSKTGYKSHFDLTDCQLKETLNLYPVIALGGVVPESFKILYDLKFAGAALLGYLWSPKSTIGAKIDSLLSERMKLKI